MIRTVPSSLYFPPDLTLCLVNKLAFLGNDQWMSHVLTRTKAFQRRQRSTEGRSIIPGQALLYRISIFLFLDCISVLATLHSIHTPVLLPGKSPGQRSLVGCSPWGHKESDMTEQLHLHFSLSFIGEGNGNPLQYSCLENFRDGGAWWAAVYRVAQSRTRLKRLSSSSSSSILPKPDLLSFFIFWGNVAGYVGSQFPDHALKLHPLRWKCSLNHWATREVPYFPKFIPGWPLRLGPSLPHVQPAPRSIPSLWVWEAAL